MKPSPRNLFSFFLLEVAGVIAVIAFIHFPHQAAAVVGMVILAILIPVGVFLWEAHQESKEYDDEHDL